MSAGLHVEKNAKTPDVKPDSGAQECGKSGLISKDLVAPDLDSHPDGASGGQGERCSGNGNVRHDPTPQGKSEDLRIKLKELHLVKYSRKRSRGGRIEDMQLEDYR
jgi:hypothetical protein